MEKYIFMTCLEKDNSWCHKMNFHETYFVAYDSTYGFSSQNVSGHVKNTNMYILKQNKMNFP
jgi:hypothetical protein